MFKLLLAVEIYMVDKNLRGKCKKIINTSVPLIRIAKSSWRMS